MELPSLKQIDRHDQDTVGKLAVDLAELSRHPAPIPPGFVIPTSDLQQFLAQIPPSKSLAKNDLKQLPDIILSAPFPPKLEKSIINRYLKLRSSWLSQPVFNLFLSPVSQAPLPYINPQHYLQGETNLLLALKQLLAAHVKHLATTQSLPIDFQSPPPFAIIVQLAVLGEIFGHLYTIDPVNLQKNIISVEAIFGLPDLLDQQAITPDYYQINKYSQTIVKKQIHHQKQQLIFSQHQTKLIKLTYSQQHQPKLTDHQLIDLTQIGKTIEQYYLTPQKITWTLYKNQFYVQNITPIEIHHRSPSANQVQQAITSQTLKILLNGISASPGIVKGQPKIITQPEQATRLKKHHIAVLSHPTSEYSRILKKASAIIADFGSQTSDLVISARELGIPCLIGTQTATQTLKHHRLITVDATNGKVYQGAPQITHKKVKISLDGQPPKYLLDTYTATPPKTATQIDAYLTDLNQNLHIASLPLDGVGLLPMETLIKQLDSHPQFSIEKGQQQKLIKQFTDSLLSVLRAFSPRPVLLRLSTITSEEFRQLKWGHQYEQLETNPFLGNYGTLKHIHASSIFDLEIKTIKQLRHRYLNNNLQIIIPLVRSTHELIECKKILASSGLNRTPSFKFWLNIAVPSNLIMLNDYHQIGIDGLVIDLDHLTQLILGLDKDHSHYPKIYQLNHPAIDWYLTTIIRRAHKLKLPVSLHSRYLTQNTHIVEKIIKLGISRITILPEQAENFRSLVYHFENHFVSSR